MQFLKSISIFILAICLTVTGFCQDFPTGGDAAFPQTIETVQEPSASQTGGNIWSQEPNQLSADLATSSFEHLSLYGNENSYTTFDDPPGDPGDLPDPVDNETPVPLDGGLTILLAVGIGLGMKTFLKNKKCSSAQPAAIKKMTVLLVCKASLKNFTRIYISIAKHAVALLKLVLHLQNKMRYSIIKVHIYPD